MRTPFWLRPCGPTEYECEKCTHFSLLTSDGRTKCVSYCPSGYYANTLTYTCEKCAKQCLQCNGPSRYNCTECQDAYLKVDTHECTQECPDDGYFTTVENECKPCDPNCLTCSIESTHCSKCKDDLDYANQKAIILKYNRCLVESANVECDNGSYFDSNTNECKLCDLTCLECNSSSESSCIKCPERRPLLQDGRCVQECDDDHYLDESANKCFKCSSMCVECSKYKNECVKCAAGYQLNNYKYCEKILTQSDCHDSNCLECSGNGEADCWVCQNGYALSDGKCVKTASEGRYIDHVMTDRGLVLEVKNCPQACDKCTKFECVKCTHGYNLVSGKCNLICNSGYYATNDAKCVKCIEPCRTCSNETSCLSCISNKILFKSSCVESCPESYFSKGDSCQPCHLSCRTCKGTDRLECLSCNDGFKYMNGECRSECPDATYYNVDEKKCMLCNSSSCLWCIKTANTCTKCINPLALDVSTFSCKPCCARSLRGKLKNPSCCNCADPFDGYCSIDEKNTSENIFKKIFKQESFKFSLSSSSSNTSFGQIVFLLLSIAILIVCILYLKYTCKKSYFAHQSVKYSILRESDN